MLWLSSGSKSENLQSDLDSFLNFMHIFPGDGTRPAEHPRLANGSQLVSHSLAFIFSVMIG
jgi:hypothetical protein